MENHSKLDALQRFWYRIFPKIVTSKQYIGTRGFEIFTNYRMSNERYNKKDVESIIYLYTSKNFHTGEIVREEMIEYIPERNPKKLSIEAYRIHGKLLEIGDE